MSFDGSCLILKNLLLLQKNQLGILEGCYLALIPKNTEFNVVGTLSLMYRELQIKQKVLDDLQWKILRKYLSFFKNLRVGIMLEALSAHELLENELYIDTISIKKEFRGLGLGTRLLNYAENQARAKKFDKISLYVSKRNIKAIKLYEKLGYQKIKKKKSWLSKSILNIPIFFKMLKIIK
ncbi:MAG: hypothetical protein BAJALOKI3v1_620013 [Promethearchaeota archaeon]|nr:MAG: hypothetical protein BAJALOKI3v1_620013 [Candidatus Lokiarchaeota archaeon]